MEEECGLAKERAAMGSGMVQKSKTQNSITGGLSKQSSTVTKDSILCSVFSTSGPWACFHS